LAVMEIGKSRHCKREGGGGTLSPGLAYKVHANGDFLPAGGPGTMEVQMCKSDRLQACSKQPMEVLMKNTSIIRNALVCSFNASTETWQPQRN